MAGELPVNGGSRPVPDPTELTDRAIAKAEKALTDHIDSQIAVLVERLHGIDTATELRLREFGRTPMQMDEKIKTVTDLVAEKFISVEQQLLDRTIWLDEKYASIAQQFKERDIRSEREARDNKVAVDAAFAAQKEAASEQNKSNTLAITKSETSTQETINKLAELFKTTTDAISDKVDDLKERVGRTEGIKQGGNEGRQALSWGLGIVVAVITIGTVLAAILASKP